jgi:putative transposase
VAQDVRGGLKMNQWKRLKEFEQENAELKRLVSQLSLEKLVLKDIASGDFQSLNDGAVR